MISSIDASCVDDYRLARFSDEREFLGAFIARLVDQAMPASALSVPGRVEQRYGIDAILAIQDGKCAKVVALESKMPVYSSGKRKTWDRRKGKGVTMSHFESQLIRQQGKNIFPYRKAQFPGLPAGLPVYAWMLAAGLATGVNQSLLWKVDGLQPSPPANKAWTIDQLTSQRGSGKTWADVLTRIESCQEGLRFVQGSKGWGLASNHSTNRGLGWSFFAEPDGPEPDSAVRAIGKIIDALEAQLGKRQDAHNLAPRDGIDQMQGLGLRSAMMVQRSNVMKL